MRNLGRRALALSLSTTVVATMPMVVPRCTGGGAADQLMSPGRALYMYRHDPDVTVGPGETVRTKVTMGFVDRGDRRVGGGVRVVAAPEPS